MYSSRSGELIEFPRKTNRFPRTLASRKLGEEGARTPATEMSHTVASSRKAWMPTLLDPGTGACRLTLGEMHASRQEICEEVVKLDELAPLSR